MKDVGGKRAPKRSNLGYESPNESGSNTTTIIAQTDRDLHTALRNRTKATNETMKVETRGEPMCVGTKITYTMGFSLNFRATRQAIRRNLKN